MTAAIVAVVAALGVDQASAGPRTPSRPATRFDAGSIRSAAAAFAPIDACRLIDTRDGGAALAPDHELAVPVAGACGIDGTATAVAVSITIVDPTTDGFVTAWPGGEARPLASALSFGAGETRSNGAIVALGDDGTISMWTSAATAQVVVDVTGVFAPAERARAGRFVPLTPERLLDTRATGTPLAPGGEVTVPLPLGVPTDATALAVSIVATDPVGPGYLTAYATGADRPAVSTLATDTTGQMRSTGSIVPVGSGGFTVFSQSGGDVIVDVTGWFTGDSAANSPSGLFVAMMPTRLADTRSVAPVYPGGQVEIDPAMLSTGSALAIAANWTMTGTWQSGFVTVHPARTEVPAVATVNADRRGQSVSQWGINATSTAGLTVFASAGTHVLVDVTGWFVGAPRVTSPTAPPAVNNAVADTERRVLLIGDSTLAGVRWYSNSQHALGGANFTLDAESCRRLIGTSCYGREKRTPPNAVTAINSHEGPFDTIVIMTGYNDWAANFSDAFDQVVEAARGKGATEILWLTYREGSAYRNPSGGTKQDKGFRQENQILRDKVSSGAFPDVRILDWNTYTAPTTGWFTKDGVHFTLPGAYAAADYISRQIAYSHHQPCPAPWTVGGPIETPCSNPDLSPAAVDPMALYDGNPNDIHCYEIGSDHHINCRKDPKLSP